MNRVERIAKLRMHAEMRTGVERDMFLAKIADMTRIARLGAELYATNPQPNDNRFDTYA